MSRQRTAQKRHTREMLELVARIGSYSDNQLRDRAANPKLRAELQQIVATCDHAIEVSESAFAKASLSLQLRRLRSALDNPAVAA